MPDIPFALDGHSVCCVPFGSGHINETWLVVTGRPHLYILQHVNTAVFPDAAGLMTNILRVTEHLRKKDPDPRHVLTLVPTRDGRPYVLDAERGLWRMYEYITGGICLDRAETPADLRLSGKAFGRFQRDMADFPAEELTEVIPGFHDTPGRFRAFHRALAEDRLNRAAGVRREIDFLLEREKDAGALLEMRRAGELPLRVTHNDTKLNNVMLDEDTREPLCILDLDTVMPGLAAFDYGDSIRFGASTTAEDEPDAEKTHLDLTLLEEYTRGFLGACGGVLTKAEKETLADGARLITVENAVRFLTDYLDGDVYYHVSRPGHNLDRTRTQIALIRDMEAQEGRIRKIIQSLDNSEEKADYM